MKPSRYNFFYRIDDSATLGYNTLTTSLVSLSDEEFAHFQAYCQDPSDGSLDTPGMEGLRNGLVETGLLVPDELDELERLRFIDTAARRANRQLSLTLIPTLTCNFRCNYCFSYAQPGQMRLDVQKALLQFADSMLNEVGGLTLAWYGGEPLLCLETIESLGGSLRALCARHDLAMPGDMIVTNGYLLSGRTAERLRAAGVNQAQVTLDGDRKTHDARRPLAGNRATYDRILRNLIEACGLLDIQVRINVDRSNAETALGALDALAAAGLQGKVRPYFAQVRELSGACGDIAGACLTNREFSTLVLELTRQALVRGFHSFPYPRSALGGQCVAEYQFGYVVAPNGLLFNCWAEASRGPEWSVGSVFDPTGSREQKGNLTRSPDLSPMAKDECRECRLLPICMGGCPHLRQRGGGETDCATWRYTLGEILAIRFKLRDRFQLQPIASASNAQSNTGSSN